MKKIIKELKEGIVQITVCDERWYIVGDKYIPSVTWICSYYPKGIAFHKWLASKGWDEAEALKVAAGDKGSKVHRAIEDLLDEKEIPMDAKYLNPSTEKEEELSLSEYECLMSFVAWWQLTKPVLLAKELVLINHEYNYAGTADLVCKIGGKIWLVDFKTGQDIWPEYELQLSAYRYALLDAHQIIDNMGILQLGYRRNRAGYKFTEVEDKFNLFLAAREIWANENEGVEPQKKDYPTALRLETIHGNNTIPSETHDSKRTKRNPKIATPG